MILFPSVDELLKRIDSRYSLVMLASKRAHDLLSIAKNKFGCHKKYFDLIRMNQLESTIIYPGQILRCSE